MVKYKAVRSARPRDVILALMGLLLIWFLLFAPGIFRGRARRLWCVNNLKTFGLALKNYHEGENAYPPAVFLDGEGRPAHSWRMLLAPYFEGHSPRKYSTSLAWNSPENEQACEEGDRCYTCDLEAETFPHRTAVVAVTAPGFFFHGDRATALDEVTDGLSRTIVAIHIGDSGILCSEPRDLTWEELVGRLRARRASAHEGGFYALFGDGSVRFIQDFMDLDDLHGLFTIAGNEKYRLGEGMNVP